MSKEDEIRNLIGLCEKHIANFEARHKMPTAKMLEGVTKHDQEPGSKGAIDSSKLDIAAWLVVRQIREKLKAL